MAAAKTGNAIIIKKEVIPTLQTNKGKSLLNIDSFL
jgi:hypothetical protein